MASRVLRAVPITVVLLIVAAGIILAVLGHWRRGSAAFALAAGVAALVRLVAPTRVVGVLAVRSRRFDVVFLALLAALLATMAVTVVDPGA